MYVTHTLKNLSFPSSHPISFPLSYSHMHITHSMSKNKNFKNMFSFFFGGVLKIFNKDLSWLDFLSKI